MWQALEMVQQRLLLREEAQLVPVVHRACPGGGRGGTRAPAARPPRVWRRGAWEVPVDPPGRASPGGNPGAANRARGAPADGLKLHANATTTPRTRAYIQQSSAPTGALARELGIHSRTVARWKARTELIDRSTRPHRLATMMTDWEEALIVELRRSLALPLDDITEAMRRCVNPALSRSAIHRCLQRHGISARLAPAKAPAAAFHTDAPAGFIHIDVKYLPPLNRRRSYAGACPGAKPGSPSIGPPALSISKSCPIAGAKPPPAFSIASAPASRSTSIPC